jgi:hypothetical protein
MTNKPRRSLQRRESQEAVREDDSGRADDWRVKTHWGHDVRFRDGVTWIVNKPAANSHDGIT